VREWNECTVKRVNNLGTRWRVVVIFTPRPRYGRITSKKTLSFCMVTFSASHTNLTLLLSQAHDCSWYVTRRILAPLFSDWISTMIFVHSPVLLHQPRLALTVLAPEAVDFMELINGWELAVYVFWSSLITVISHSCTDIKCFAFCPHGLFMGFLFLQ